MQKRKRRCDEAPSSRETGRGNDKSMEPRGAGPAWVAGDKDEEEVAASAASTAAVGSEDPERLREKLPKKEDALVPPPTDRELPAREDMASAAPRPPPAADWAAAIAPKAARGSLSQYSRRDPLSLKNLRRHECTVRPRL
jgi:hypothetical protein